MLLTMSQWFLCCLLSGVLIIQTNSEEQNLGEKFSLEQSWDLQNLIDLNGEQKGRSNNNELVALREQPIREIRVKRESPDEFTNTSGSSEQSYFVICRNDNITVVIKRNETMVQLYDLDNMHLENSSCKASYNSTHVYITTALNECDTTYSQTAQKMYYNNTLYAATPTSAGKIITRKQSFTFSFKCSYDRLISVDGVKFVPPKEKIVIEQSNLGNFTVNMGSYSDAGFISSSSEEYPVFKSFSDRINIQYGIDTKNPDIVVRAETCRATPSDKPDDEPQYEFISGGCDKDPTITHLTSGLQQIHQFSIQVFRFMGNHTFVYIHCELRLCNRKTPGSICTRNTTCSNRRRRDISDATERSYQLSIGPIMYREETIVQEKPIENDEGQTKTTESSPSTIMIAIVACAALIVVLMAIGVVVLVKRRRIGNYATSLEVIPMQYPADKVEALGIVNEAGK